MKKITFTSLLILIVLFSGTVYANTISVSTWGVAYDSMEKLIPEFEQETGINVELRKEDPENIRENLILSFNSGTGAPDIAFMEDYWAPNFLAKGGLVDLTDKMKEYENEFVDFKINATTWEGKIYGMPWDVGPVAVFYRRDIFNEAGLPTSPEKVSEILSTWDKYYEVAKEIKEKTGSYMLAYGQTGYDNRIFQNMLQQQELGYFNENGEVILEKTESIKTAKYINKLWKEELALDSAAWTPGWYAAIDTGEVATTVSGSWLGGFLKEWISPETEGLWGVVPMPAWEEGGVRTANSGGSALYITKQSNNKKEAWKFLEYMSAKKDNQLFRFENYDVFPSLKTTYTDEIFEKEDPYFGGQKHRKLFADLAVDIPPFEYTSYFDEANKYVKDAMESIAMGKECDVEIKNAAKKLRNTIE